MSIARKRGMKTYRPPFTLALALALALAQQPLQAQPSASQPSPPPEPTETQAPAKALDKVEVTGSRIKRLDSEGPSPVVIIDRTQIDHSGAVSLTDALRNLPQLSSGSYSETFTNNLAAGGAGASLRGLGLNSTLVLVNGRRFPKYGLSLNINQGFVDLNSIPLAAVERIEVLKDGASAIYGADAMAGVINIILRKSYDGLELSGQSGHMAGADQHHASLVTGFSGRTSMTFAFDWMERGEVMMSDRPYSRSADHSGRGLDYRSSYGFPGTAVLPDGSTLADPTCPPQQVRASGSGSECAYDFSHASTLIPSTDRLGGVINLNHEFTSSLSAFGQVFYQGNTTGQQMAATPMTLAGGELPTWQASSPTNPFGQDVQLYYRTLGAGPRREAIDNHLLDLVGGLQGDFSWLSIANDWTWEAAYNYGRTRTDRRGQQGNIRSDHFQDALDSGALNPWNGAANDPAVFQDLLATTDRRGINKTDGVDLSTTGGLFTLPTGLVSLALGAEYREESLSDRSDPLSEAMLIAGNDATGSRGGRHQVSEYAELSVPLHETLEAQLAVRHEDYSDFGTTTNPKYGLLFRPKSWLMLRSSYAEGFRAPSLTEEYLGNTVSYPYLADPLRCPVTGDPRDCGGSQYQTSFGGNPNLKPEESRSYSLGVVVEPRTGLSFGVDYWHYHIDNVIAADTAYVLDHYPDDHSRVTRRPASASDLANGLPGEIQFIHDSYMNLAAQKTHGVDVDGRYTLHAGRFGLLTTTLGLTRIISFKRKNNSEAPWMELAGAMTSGGLLYYSYPKTRGTLGLDWSRDEWGATWSAHYTSRYDDLEVSGLSQRHIGAMITFDGELRYQPLANTTLRVGAQNIFSRKPPFTYAYAEGYDYETHDPRGQFLYLGITQHF